MTIEKLLPQNVEAESAVLGSLLIDREAVSLVREFLRPADFYRDAHRIIFEAMCDLDDDEGGDPIDLITLTDELGRRGKLDEIGGIGYVSSLANQVPTSANVEYYARIVERTAILRRLISAAGKIAGVAYNEPDAAAALDEAEKLIFQVSQGWLRSTSVAQIAGGLSDLVTRMGELAAGGRGQMTGVPTRLRLLDRRTNGFQRGDLVIVAARPSVGKSSLMLSMAHGQATRDYPALIFSLEMSEEQMLQRLLAMDSNVDLAKIRAPGDLDDDDWILVNESLGRLSQYPLYIDETPAISLTELRSKARRAVMDYGITTIYVDYLQLMRGGGSGDLSSDAGGYVSRRGETREQEVSQISKGLKSLARELGVTVVALSQLSRAVESRADRKPQLSDLRESGSIEQDSDIVLLMWREELFKPDTERVNIADLDIAKHRNGPTGQFQVFFQKATTRFRDLAIFPNGEATAGDGEINPVLRDPAPWTPGDGRES